MVWQPGAVLFDFYGTLSQAVRVEPRRLIAEALGCTIDQLIAVLSESFYERAIGKYGNEMETMRWVAGRLGIALGEAGVRRAVAARHQAELLNMRLREDAVPVLAELRQRGLRIGVVSDCTHELVALWPQLRSAPFVDVTAFSIEVGVCKPDPRIYLAAIDALGLAPSDCLYVGDGASLELTGARAIGMTAVRLDPHDVADHVSYRREDGWTGPTIHELTEHRTPGSV